MFSGEVPRERTAGTWHPGAGSGADRAAPLVAAVRAAPDFGLPVRAGLRLLIDGAELHAMPSTCPKSDPIGRGRAIAGGAALCNLELAVANLGHRPLVRLLPEPDDPLHLATVQFGQEETPDPAGRRLHRAILQQGAPLRPVERPYSGRPVEPSLRCRLHEAASRHGARAMPVGGDQLRSVGTVLAESQDSRHGGEAHLVDVGHLLAQHATTTHTRQAASTMLIDRLGHGTLLLVYTASDRPSEWITAGWATQNASLTAVSHGLAASVVDGMLDAPGVRAALAVRLRLAGCPQVLLHVGWPQPRQL